jgi:pyruvate formate lyase activating enzyme
MSNPIYNITPFTLLDYPNKSACIFWYAGCNMRCLYCYNPEIVLGKGKFSFPEMVSFLESRKGLLDAVVFSGGECLIHKDIVEQIRLVKTMGFLVKVDTNGSKPEVIKTLIEQRLLDYVALDFKANRESFSTISQSDLFDQFEKSLQLLLEAEIAFEVRTTYHSELLAKEELSEMIEYLKYNEYTGTYYIQHFRNNAETLGNLSHSLKNIDSETITAEHIKVVFR